MLENAQDQDVETIDRKLHELAPEESRRYWRFAKWDLIAFAIMVVTIVFAFVVGQKREPTTGIILGVGFGAAFASLFTGCVLLLKWLPLGRQRNRLRAQRRRIIRRRSQR